MMTVHTAHHVLLSSQTDCAAAECNCCVCCLPELGTLASYLAVALKLSLHDCTQGDSALLLAVPTGNVELVAKLVRGGAALHVADCRVSLPTPPLP